MRSSECGIQSGESNKKRAWRFIRQVRAAGGSVEQFGERISVWIGARQATQLRRPPLSLLIAKDRDQGKAVQGQHRNRHDQRRHGGYCHP